MSSSPNRVSEIKLFHWVRNRNREKSAVRKRDKPARHANDLGQTGLTKHCGYWWGAQRKLNPSPNMYRFFFSGSLISLTGSSISTQNTILLYPCAVCQQTGGRSIVRTNPKLKKKKRVIKQAMASLKISDKWYCEVLWSITFKTKKQWLCASELWCHNKTHIFLSLHLKIVQNLHFWWTRLLYTCGWRAQTQKEMFICRNIQVCAD